MFALELGDLELILDRFFCFVVPCVTKNEIYALNEQNGNKSLQEQFPALSCYTQFVPNLDAKIISTGSNLLILWRKKKIINFQL